MNVEDRLDNGNYNLFISDEGIVSLIWIKNKKIFGNVKGKRKVLVYIDGDSLNEGRMSDVYKYALEHSKLSDYDVVLSTDPNQIYSDQADEVINGMEDEYFKDILCRLDTLSDNPIFGGRFGSSSKYHRSNVDYAGNRRIL